MDNDRDDKISAYWEDPKTSSMNDKYIATLETEMIRRHIRPGERVLDLGCGDGTGSAGYRVGVGAYFALERSWKMLREFKDREPGIALVRGDLRALPFSRETDNLFPVVITQRALINLPDEAAQEEVLNILPELVRLVGHSCSVKLSARAHKTSTPYASIWGMTPSPPAGTTSTSLTPLLRRYWPTVWS